MQSPSPLSSRPSNKRRVWPLIVFAFFILAGLFAWANQQLVYDSVRYWQYNPSSEIADLSSRVSFTDRGKFVFYATHPQLDGSSTFNDKCNMHEHNAAILGCYSDDRIYLYNVSDERLNGIKEVTAAHEMLHAAYQRLSPTEKSEINKLIEAEYAQLKNNKDLADRMAFYARTEPGERDNELHSIIGTEVSTVSPGLEAHYAKYFSNRSAVVAHYQAYHKAFAELESQKNDLSKKLDDLSAQIETASAKYNEAANVIQGDIAMFNTRADKGDFTSQAQFRSERASLVARVDGLSGQRENINDLIAQYNELRNQYNETITQSNELYQSIDSKLAPAPQV